MDLEQNCSEELPLASSTTNNSTTASSSPRRRNAPFDIDAALYLQSQAKNVQEPATASKQQQQQPKQQQTVSANLATTSTTSNPTSSGQQQQLAGVAPRRQCLDEHLYYHQQHQQQSNISVDYIDCLSNNDLDNNHSSSYYNNDGHPQRSCLGANAAASWQTCNSNNIPTFSRSAGRHRWKHNRFYRNRIGPTPEAHTQETDLGGTAGTMGATFSNGISGGICYPMMGGDCVSPCGHSAAARVAPEADRSSKLNNQANSSISDESAYSAVSSGQQQQQLHEHHSGSQVLFPISISEVKKRTYFIGSLGQDSLLGEEELYRYFPNGRVRIFACTWNQNRKRAPMNLNDLLLPDRLVYMPDIYAIGIQEAFSSQQDYLRDWEVELQTTLGANHVLLRSCSLGVLHLALFVRRDLIWFCSTPEESTYNSRSMPTNMIKTKGAVSIAFRFFGTSFMFTNCHFPAHENRLKDRVDEYRRIINSIDLPKDLKLLKPRYLSQDSTARFDCVFFMGDLNFRLEQRTFDETINILEDVFQQPEPSYEALIQNDELIKVMETDQAFHGFDESPIRFPPTYKFLAQTNKYDKQTRRVPSYTDRILFRSKRQRHIQCLIYDWLPQLISSDHKPVYCLFDVLVRPGHEQNMVGSLNAGLFQRPIYLEALKRRAENADGIGDNGASGNLICSIT